MNMVIQPEVKVSRFSSLYAVRLRAHTNELIATLTKPPTHKRLRRYWPNDLLGKQAVQRGIWVPTQHLLWDQGNPRKILIELAGRRTFRTQTAFY
jgi:hypothetical protein